MATAIEQTTVPSTRGSKIVEITEANNNYHAISASASTVFAVIIDNTANPTYPVFVKLYNHATPTVGTTDPELIVFAPGGQKTSWVQSVGWAFGTALSAACVKEAGTGGTTPPDNDVTVTVYV